MVFLYGELLLLVRVLLSLEFFDGKVEGIIHKETAHVACGLIDFQIRCIVQYNWGCNQGLNFKKITMYVYS